MQWSLQGTGGAAVVSTPLFPFQNGGIQPTVDPWTLSACPLFVSLWVFKTEALKVTPERRLSVRTHTHAIDCFGMHSPRVNRVTSSASCSVLKLSTPEPCATYQDIYMILGVLCQRPQLILKPWHLFALPVAMKMAWRWFSGKVKEGTASSGTDDDCTEARITKLAYLRHGLD